MITFLLCLIYPHKCRLFFLLISSCHNFSEFIPLLRSGIPRFSILNFPALLFCLQFAARSAFLLNPPDSVFANRHFHFFSPASNHKPSLLEFESVSEVFQEQRELSISIIIKMKCKFIVCSFFTGWSGVYWKKFLRRKRRKKAEERLGCSANN